VLVSAEQRVKWYGAATGRSWIP